MLDVFGVQYFISRQCIQPTGCGDDDVGAFALVAKEFRIFGYWCAAVESADSDIGHVLGEAGVFVFDLEGEFAGVAKNEDGHLPVDGFELLKSGQDKHSGFSVTRLRLTQDIHS